MTNSRWLKASCISVIIHALLVLGYFLLVFRFDTNSVGQSTQPHPAVTGHSLTFGWTPNSPRRKTPPLNEELWLDIEVSHLVVPPSETSHNIKSTNTGTKGSTSKTEGISGASATPVKTPNFLTAPLGARSVVFVVDRSISMGPLGALNTACQEIIACLRSLAPTVHFQIIPYNKIADPLLLQGKRQLVLANTYTVQQAIEQLNNLRPSGATDHCSAVRRALQLKPEILYLLTDADDLSAQEVRLLSESNLGKTAIHVVELTANRTSEAGLLRRLALDNRGTYKRIDPREHEVQDN